MAFSQQQTIAQTGASNLTYTLEFRTWNGSAYVWTDYTERLLDFSGIGSTVEEGAFPNAFRMNVGRIECNNSDGMFNNLDVLDGLLYNSSEPYGKSIYKRMLRIKCNNTAIGVALVRDVKPRSDRNSVMIETISLDARASDQACDGETAERHPLGDTSKVGDGSDWTTTAPAALTDEVAMYRWRDEESEGNLSYGWFKDKHYSEIIERTAWALDDLATDITETYRLMTADDREIATTRNIPPDDPAVSEGVTPDRCRVVIWNPERSCLVCCVGHKIYDYNPTTNVYTLRNTLTAGRDVVRAFYTTEADSGGENKRIVLVQCDIEAYSGSSGGRVTTAWCTTLDATGTGAYTVLDTERSMGTDVFPGTHQFREEERIGQIPPDIAGENLFVPFRQEIRYTAGLNATDNYRHLDTDGEPVSLFDAPAGGAPNRTLPATLGRGYFTGDRNLGDAPGANGWRWSNGNFFSCSLNIYTAGGRLYYITWDSTNKYRLNYINLSTYAAGSYLALGGANTRVPYFLYSPQGATFKKRLYCCQMQWKDTATDYSIAEIYHYDFSSPGWTQTTYLSGATGSNQAWMITELTHEDSGNSITCILFNRETLKWRLANDIATAWASMEAICYSAFQNLSKDQENRLEGLHTRANGDLFFVEAGPNLLWKLKAADGVLYPANLTPADAAKGDPINADRGLGSYMTSTPVNYPDSSTPEGILFWISAADYVDAGTDHPNGRYTLCQYANFDPGFIQLLDVSGLSFWELRTLIAEAFGFVHYYSPDGTLIFKPRTTSGAASFTFSGDNRNYLRGEVQTRGFEAILNDITVKPYAVVSEERTSEIVKGYNEASADKDGALDDVNVSGNPGENSQWRVVFTSATAYSIYKLQGVNADATTAKGSATITTTLSQPTDGTYLSITPDNWSGVFVTDDNFTFWIFEPAESLQVMPDGNESKWSDATSIAAYKRNARTFENRFIRRQIAPDYAANIGEWRKERHDIVRIEAAADPAYQPLLRCTFTDANMGYSAVTFQIMGVEHRKLAASTLTLAKT
jgi:hypothetical protein